MNASPELDPDVDDVAPSGPKVTPYDDEHLVTYLRLLDAEKDGADWTEVARIVLHRDPVADRKQAMRCWKSHLDRARWMAGQGYRRILQQAALDAAAEARWSTRH
jgi:hypothetical protein